MSLQVTVQMNVTFIHKNLYSYDDFRSEYDQTAMKRAVAERLVNVKGLAPPYHIAQVQLLHVADEFEHSRSAVEAACGGKRKTMPSSAGDVYF